MARKPDITDTEIEKRRFYALKLKYEGYTANEILVQINGLANKERWGEVSLRTLKRDLSATFLENYSPQEDAELIELKKSVLTEQMEKIIGKLYRSIESKEDWKPFEEVKTTQAYIDAVTKYAKLCGWIKNENGSADYWFTQKMYPSGEEVSGEMWDRASIAVEKLKQNDPMAHQQLIEFTELMAEGLKTLD